MKKYLVILFLTSIILVLMFIKYPLIINDVKGSINILINSFIPSLLPYIIIISLFKELGGFDILGYVFQYIFKPILNIDYKCTYLVLAGLISGYPLPSLLLSNEDTITKKEEQIISIFVFPSLSFLLTQIIPYTGINIIFLFIISSFLLYFLLSLKDKEKVEYVRFSTLKELLRIKYNKMNFSLIYRKVIINSIINMVIISANIVIFSFICALLPIISPSVQLLQGILEFSRASINLASQSSYLSYLSLIFVLLFGGLSVFMQNSALLSHTNFSLKKYIIYRLELIVIVIILDFLIFF